MARHRRGTGAGWPTYLAVALAAAVALGVGPASVSFTSATVERHPSVDVVSDDDGALTMLLGTGISLGTTGLLVNVSNHLGADASVTVSLSAGSDGYGDLVVDGANEGDSVTVELAEGDHRRVEFSAVCDPGLADESVTVTVRADAGDVSGTATRSVPLDRGACSGVVYALPSSGALRSVLQDAGVEPHEGTGVTVTAPYDANLDGDDRNEIAFVNSSTGDVWITDAENETSKLLDAGTLSGLLDGGAEHSKSRMAVGTWNGSGVSVFFVDDGNTAIFRVDRQGDAHRIVEPSNGAGGVAGIADVDGDGAEELVFVDGSQQLRYLDDDGDTVKISNGGVGSNAGLGLGEPADFDGDGTVRIAHVDGSNNLELVTAGGTQTDVVSGVEKAPVAVFDWDGDGLAEILYVDKSSDTLYVADDIGSGVTTTQVTGADGNPIEVRTESGGA